MWAPLRDGARVKSTVGFQCPVTGRKKQAFERNKEFLVVELTVWVGFYVEPLSVQWTMH